VAAVHPAPAPRPSTTTAAPPDAGAPRPRLRPTPTTQAPIIHGAGSVYATAAPGPGVPPLGLVGSAAREIPSTAPVAFAVKAIPGAAVTFATADGGRFRTSGLDYETVIAGQDGLATAIWECTPGTSGDVHLSAASPTCVGRVDLLVSLIEPKAKP